VAKIIEFYIPDSFPRKVAWVSPARCGKVIECSSRIPTKVTRIQKGAPILRSAVIGGLGMELTDGDPSVSERTSELRRGNQEWAKSDLSQSLLPDRTHGKDNGDNAIVRLHEVHDFQPDVVD
jgi:hypothetical protein